MDVMARLIVGALVGLGIFIGVVVVVTMLHACINGI